MLTVGDDIRDRFRGAGRTDFSGPIRPTFQPPKPQPQNQPAPQPVPPRPQPQNVPVNVFGQPIARPVPRPAAPAQPFGTYAAPAVSPKKRSKKRGSKKWLVAAMALVLIGGGGAAAYYFMNKKTKTAAPVASQQAPTNQETAPTPTGTITMLMTGDFLAYDSVNNSAKSGAGFNYLPMMTPMKPVFDKYDIRFCNQATLGGGIGLGISGYPTFNAPTEWSKGLEDLGCNLLNLGTNHTNDKGQDAINAAVAYYDGHKNVLALAGANRTVEEQTIKYFTLKQVKFAYLSYTTSSQKPPGQPFSINLYNGEIAKKQLAEARKQAQFVIVAMNWGKEDSGDVQPEQETIAQELVTAGADLVVGNGPHVVQPAKVLNGAEGRQGLVWFSLGNAVNSQLPSDNLFGGVAVVNIDIATQNMTNPSFLPTYMHYEWTAAQKAKPDLNARTNLMWYPLDVAKDALAKSQNSTTIEAQTERLKNIITKFLPVKILKSTEL